MIIDTPGRVTDRITLLGRKESCIYLLESEDESAIFGGGLTYIVPDVLKQFDEFDIHLEKISRLIILHSHFDHVGIVPYFMKHFPWIKICASKKAQYRLSTPETVDIIVSMNQMVLSKMLGNADEDLGLESPRFAVDEVFEDRQVIPFGESHLEVLEVPGHSSCSMAVYVPEEKALFASDAGGIPFEDKIFASANSNFDLYQSSLEKMAGLDVEVHLSEHYGALTGEDGRNFLPRSIESAQQTRELIEQTYTSTKDVTRTVEIITDMFSEAGSNYFLPREIIQMVLGQMTRFIAGKID